MDCLRRVPRALRAFGKRSDGTVTVEFVLWLPVFLSVIMLSTDASMMFLRQSNFWNVSRETARIVSRHGLDSVAAEKFAANNAAFGNYTPKVSVKVDELASTVTVTITGRAEKMAPFGVISFALGDTVSAQVTQNSRAYLMAFLPPTCAWRGRAARLWRDEDGAGTVFGLLGILICLLFAGLSIDATNAWRNREILGLSADVAAHAGVSRLAVTGDRATSLAAAMRATELNTPAAIYGRTIYDAVENIQVLHYDPETNLVSPGGEGELNAVSVRLERNARVQNPVPTFLLQLIGRESWDISTTSVAAVVPTARCDGGNGIFARGEATLEGQAVVGSDVCIHSQTGVGLAGQSSLESGSGLSMPDLSDCRGGCSELSSPGFAAAATEMNLVTTPPADHIDRLAAGLSNPDETLPEEDVFFAAHPLADDLSALDELSVETAGLERGDVVELTTIQFDRARELPAGLVYHVSCQSSGAGASSVLTIDTRQDALPAVEAAADVAGSSEGDGMSDSGDGYRHGRQ